MTIGEELLPDPNKEFRDHSELQLLAMVLFGEGRGEPSETRKAIAHAVINRALHPSWWGKNLKEVILKPWQFSSFNGPEVIANIKDAQVDPNYKKLREPLKHESADVWEACCEDAKEVYERLTDQSIPDPVLGSNHYYDSSISTPNWADPSKFVIALPSRRVGHVVRFYRLS